MGKGIKSLGFSFVPFPAEVWDDNIALSLSEFRFLGYLCKQIRFGEALEPITDEEMMKGILENGRRLDQGCGLSSRNGIKQAREALVKRGWIEAKNLATDPTRPRWNYRLLLQKKGATVSVTARQLVSQRDTVTERQLVSPDERAVSQHDTNGVTARQLVSPDDTCNKEEEESKYLDKELETTKAKITSAPVEKTEAQKQKQANLDTWDLRRFQEELNRIQGANVGGRSDWKAESRTAAYRAGLSPERHVALLKQYFPNDPDLDEMYPTPPLFRPKPTETPEEMQEIIERTMPKWGDEAS